ncbi:hypothetical protein [Domibacillus indicus]|nr:hypothetical protein [Domibacillus indicus]
MYLEINDIKNLKIGLIGFGEVGQIFAKELIERKNQVGSTIFY